MRGALLFLFTSEALFCSDCSHFSLLLVHLLSLGFLLVFSFGLLFAPSGEVPTTVQVILRETKDLQSADHKVELRLNVAHEIDIVFFIREVVGRLIKLETR